MSETIQGRVDRIAREVAADWGYVYDGDNLYRREGDEYCIHAYDYGDGHWSIDLVYMEDWVYLEDEGFIDPPLYSDDEMTDEFVRDRLHRLVSRLDRYVSET